MVWLWMGPFSRLSLGFDIPIEILAFLDGFGDFLGDSGPPSFPALPSGWPIALVDPFYGFAIPANHNV